MSTTTASSTRNSVAEILDRMKQSVSICPAILDNLSETGEQAQTIFDSAEEIEESMRDLGREISDLANACSSAGDSADEARDEARNIQSFVDELADDVRGIHEEVERCVTELGDKLAAGDKAAATLEAARRPLVLTLDSANEVIRAKHSALRVATLMLQRIDVADPANGLVVRGGLSQVEHLCRDLREATIVRDGAARTLTLLDA